MKVHSELESLELLATGAHTHFSWTLYGIMRRTLYTLSIFFISHFALADVCLTTFEKDTINAEVIFVGKVIEVKYGAYWVNGYPTSIYTFEVLESFKGLSKWRNVTSIMSPVNGCCSPHFKMDSTFLVLGFSDGEYPNIYLTIDCSLTGLLSKPETQEYISRLGTSLKPEPTSDDLELFNERKAWFLEQEFKKTDSLNQIHTNFQNSIASEQQTNSYLTVVLVILILLTFYLVVQKVRSVKST